MIQILHLEDNPLDAILIRERLIDDGLQADITVVSNRTAFEQAIHSKRFDLVLADYYLPGFDGLTALKILQEEHITTPAILISGKLGEEAAVQSLHSGAVDYILKDNLQRLGSAVTRALDQYEQKQHTLEIERLLIKNGQLFRSAESIGKIGTFEWNFLTNELFWSDGIYKIFGFDQHIGAPTFELYSDSIHPEDRASVHQNLQEAVEKQIAIDSEYRILNQQQEVKYIRTLASVYPDATNTPAILVGVCQDVTASRDAIQRLEKSEQKYRALVEQSTDGIILSDANLVFREANKSALEILECQDSSQLVGRGPMGLISDEDLKNNPIDIDRIKQAPVTSIREARTFTNKPIVLEITSQFIGENRIQSIIRDVTERETSRRQLEDKTRYLDGQVREAETMARENAEKYRLISENSSDLITQMTADGVISYMSPSAKDILGKEPTYYQGKSFSELLPKSYHKSWNHNRSLLENRETENLLFQHEIFRDDGSTAWVETVCKPIWNWNGDLKTLQTASRDIDARKQAEMKTKNALKRERELTELRAHFVSVASHQFRTPLTVINSNVQLMELLEIDKYDPRVTQILNRITKETSRLTELMDDVLILGKLNARRLETNPELVQLDKLVRKITEAHFSHQEDGRTATIMTTGSIPPVMLDQSLTEHILTNLINNAFKYSPGKRSPHIEIRLEQEACVLSIRDWGIGVPEEDQEHLFESFYRGNNTHEFPGTGLGLVIAREFMELQGGTIGFSVPPEAGSLFWIRFPLHITQPSSIPRETTAG